MTTPTGGAARLSGPQPPSPAPTYASMPDHLCEAASDALSLAEHQFQETPMPNTAPARPPADGAAILAALHAAFTRHVILPTAHAAVGVTLWTAATHAQKAWQHAPRLVIRAPEKRCGKSRLLDIIEATCHHPLITVNASPAAIYRSIGTSNPPTLLVDEADTIFTGKDGANEELRGLLNAGHQRNRPALRWDANANAVDTIPTFAMAALAGIGTMPDTIEDRAVIIRMRRRASGEHVAPYRYRRDRPALTTLAEDLANWLSPRLADLEAAEPVMPLEDRAADTWEPLIAIADLAGGNWPGLARDAALALTADQAATAQSERIRLLADCRTAFGDADALPTKVLIESLRADPEAHWSEPPPGLTPMRLGTILADYDIRSATIRFGDPWGRLKGYYRADFADAWARYCNPAQPEPDPRAEGAPRNERHGFSRDTEQAVTPLTSNVTAVTAGTATPRLTIVNGGGAA
jgi:Protein of unknown function (DUF3631)